MPSWDKLADGTPTRCAPLPKRACSTSPRTSNFSKTPTRSSVSFRSGTAAEEASSLSIKSRPPQNLPAVSQPPANDPPDLNQFDLPPLDGTVCMAAHEGEGIIFLHRADPAVVDEDDPLASDPSLDMYDPRNGYRPPPVSSKYSPEFIARYK